MLETRLSLEEVGAPLKQSDKFIGQLRGICALDVLYTAVADTAKQVRDTHGTRMIGKRPEASQHPPIRLGG